MGGCKCMRIRSTGRHPLCTPLIITYSKFHRCFGQEVGNLFTVTGLVIVLSPWGRPWNWMLCAVWKKILKRGSDVMVHVPSHVEIHRKWCYAVCKGITCKEKTNHKYKDKIPHKYITMANQAVVHWSWLWSLLLLVISLQCHQTFPTTKNECHSSKVSIRHW